MCIMKILGLFMFDRPNKCLVKYGPSSGLGHPQQWYRTSPAVV